MKPKPLSPQEAEGLPSPFVGTEHVRLYLKLSSSWNFCLSLTSSLLLEIPPRDGRQVGNVSKGSGSSKVRRVSGITGAEEHHQQGPGYQQEHWPGTQALAQVPEPQIFLDYLGQAASPLQPFHLEHVRARVSSTLTQGGLPQPLQATLPLCTDNN